MTADDYAVWHAIPAWSTAHLLRPDTFTLAGTDKRAPITACGKPMPHALPDEGDTRRCGQCARRRTDTNDESRRTR